MGRTQRVAVGGLVYHAFNRANGRMRLFDIDGDYQAFERVLAEAADHFNMRILSYCIMPNHWHLVLWPRRDGDLSAFMKWLTLTHTQRWHAHRKTTGLGHVYQGRFKSFPAEVDEHVLDLCRYVERNPLAARLVKRAEQWRWSSLWQLAQSDRESAVPLASLPLHRPPQWLTLVNQPLSSHELNKLHESMKRGRPFGDALWQQRIARELGLESTLRQPGRPPRVATASRMEQKVAST